VSVTKMEVGRDVLRDWWLGFEVEEVGAGCGGYVETGLV